VGSTREEYTAGVIAFKGQNPVSIVMRRDLRDGNTYRAYVNDYPELNAMAQKVALALGVYGPVNFQFRIDKEGVPKIFEINARYSGTTPLRARAGFNEVELALRHLVLGEPIAQPEVKKVTFLRYWDDLMIESDKLLRSNGGGHDHDSYG
jgi:carbamoyl-phosphate synthase large subunit